MSEQLSETVLIVNKRGLHARASAKFCAAAAEWDADIRVEKDGVEVGGCSIMGLLMLGAGIGSKVTIMTSGPQAAEALKALTDLVCEKFGEEV